VVDIDCVTSLQVAFHELQLVRIEQHLVTPRNHTSNISRRRLLLGDVHTDPQQRLAYRPMGFQPALVPHRVRYITCSYHNFISLLLLYSTNWAESSRPGVLYL